MEHMIKHVKRKLKVHETKKRRKPEKIENHKDKVSGGKIKKYV